MEETLIIKNFGPIESVELKLKRFTILIGEQATGKSTVAKVLAVCRYFSYIVGNVNFMEEAFESGLMAWGLIEAVEESSYIYYECNDYKLTVKDFLEVDFEIGEPDETPDRIERHFFRPILEAKSQRFDNLLNELKKIKPGKPEGYGWPDFEWRIPTSFFQNDVASIMENPFYLPTERSLQSIFSLGRTSIQNISDSLFNQLAELDQIARVFKNDTLIEPLDITYKNENGRGYIKKRTDKKFYSLYNGATGYQSTIPIILSIDYYNNVKRKNKMFLLEEPELGLFPSAQNKLVMYVIEKSIANNHRVLLTTHSPYILTSLNNLLYANEIGKEHEEAINAIVEKKYWLNTDDVSAYRLLADGKVRDIFDDELKQIDTGEIDEVSRELNRIWDRISDVRFSSVDED